MNPTNELYKPLQIAYGHFNQILFKDKLPKVIFTVQRQKGVFGYFAPERWGSSDGNNCHEIAINPAYFGKSSLLQIMQTLVHEMVHCWQQCYGKPGRRFYHNQEWAAKMESIGLIPSSTGEPGGDKTGQYMSDYPQEGGPFLEAYYLLINNNEFKVRWIDRKAISREKELLDSLNTPPDESSNQDIESTDLNQDKSLPLTISSDDIPTIVTEDISPLINELPSDFFIPLENEVKRKTRLRYQCKSCGAIVYGKQNLNIICGDCNIHFTVTP